MNNQLVFRTTDLMEFEVLHFETTFFDIEKYQRKRLSINALLELLVSCVNKKTTKSILHHSNIFETDTENVVAYTKTSEDEVFILDLKEQFIHTFYNEKHYKIIHPNCFVKIKVLENRISNMYIYPYNAFNGLGTVLYDNPFPNIFTNNETCMGSADRTLGESKTKSVLAIIETAYTHSNTNFKSKKLKDTEKTFQYLSKNKFPYKQLMSSNLKLKDLIELCKLGN